MEKIVLKRLSFVFKQSDFERVFVYKDTVGRLNVDVDVHGLSTREANRFINNIINIIHMDCRVTIIHGYNHGTAIRTMLEGQFNNNHVKKRQIDPINPGRTLLLIA